MKKVHRVIKLNQNAWLKPYIDMNTNLRKKAHNFENFYFKLMNNVGAGKIMENMRKNIEILTLSQQKEEEENV